MDDFLRYRQIHLDLHTSEQLISICGEEFDAGARAQMLAGAHVDWVTCLACCHHGTGDDLH